MVASIRPLVLALVLFVLAVSAAPVAEPDRVAKRAAAAPAVSTPRPWKRDLLGDLLGGGSDSDDSSDDPPAYKPGTGRADFSNPRGWAKRDGYEAEFSNPRGWVKKAKRDGFQEDISTPRGWVKRAPEPTPAVVA